EVRSVAMPPPHHFPEIVTTTTTQVDENKERGNWTSGIEFLLSCLSYAVGLGNVWRFPYLCYRNGGGAFLIPYTIMLFFVGLPLFLLELAFGQYASEGPITIWKISPLFQGLGYAMFLMSALVCIYYNMIIAWALFYLLSSFSSQLPWSNCNNSWNTKACRRFDAKNCSAINGTMLHNGTCVLASSVSREEWINISSLKENSKMASDEYFHNFVLELTEGIDVLGDIRWELAICLLICWLVVFFCLFKGVKSIGKVVYFTALFPYVVLTILLIRGLTLDGAYEGIRFYLTPDWVRLKEARVWGDAAMQIFFSLSPCWGGLITLASYNRFHNNCFRDTLFIAFGNCGTSIFAGFVIFSVIGFMANELGVAVKDVAAQGAGLAFVAYPEAVTKLPLSPLWSFLFFTMLLTLGLGTQFTLVETVVTTIVDTWPKKCRRRKPFVLFCCCIAMFTLGLVMCSQGGMYVLQLMDNFCASFSALIIGFVEVCVISWIYGIDRFLDDMKVMMNEYPFPRLYWRTLWKFITPCLIMFILIFSWCDMQPTQYGEYTFPEWATPVGWFLSLISVSAIPTVAVYKLYKADGPIMESIKTLIQPTNEWGPKLKVHRLVSHSPKHTDSQVPLASQFDADVESNDSDDLKKNNIRGYFIDDSYDAADTGLRITIKEHLNESGL
ncbi:Sodium- and chloride-dependent glycine transporter 1-like protein, partial [Leptotrombidium deliense]